MTLLLLLLTADQLLLWGFLGHLPWWATVAAAALVAGFALSFSGPARAAAWRPPFGAVAICALVAVLVFLLGGEGRLVYANTDWQVRYAVLRDLTLEPWPFLYVVHGSDYLLRAPLGMYLLPALAGRWLGFDAAQAALLVQNAALLTLLFLLGGHLFQTVRARAIALAIVVGFSGMDIIGQLLLRQPLLLSSQRWNVAVFTSHLEEAFAGPQHGLAGWTGAVLFLLWRDRKIALAAFLTPVPLLALWSPLAMAGVLPFAALATIDTLRRRELRLRDVLLPACALAVAVPGLVYLTAGSREVGGGAARIGLAQYVIFELLEVAPYLLGVAFLGWRSRFGGGVLVVTAAVLLLTPLVQVSTSSDFVTRVSIPALAVLAVAVADMLVQPGEMHQGPWRWIVIVALLLGLPTPAFEVVRALVYPPAPEVTCSYFGVVPDGSVTYVVPAGRLDRRLAPANPTRVTPRDPVRCWAGKWPNPLYREFPERVAPADWDERL